jgi:hypothetical protein
MRIMLRRRNPGDIEFGIIYGGIVFFILIAAKFPPLVDLAPSCIFKRIFGIACPTCGATRSITFLSQFDVVSSFFMNPLVCIGVIFTVFFLLHDFFTLFFDTAKIGFSVTEREKNRLRILIIVLVLINWLYLIFYL